MSLTLSLALSFSFFFFFSFSKPHINKQRNKQFLETPTYISKLDIIPYQVAVARENL